MQADPRPLSGWLCGNWQGHVMDLRWIIQILLRDYDAHEAAVLDRRETFEALGRRLVCGELGEHGMLDVRDVATGELLFQGHFDDAMEEWDESWVDIAAIDRLVNFHETDIPGLPWTMRNALLEWVERNPAEARTFAHGS